MGSPERELAVKRSDPKPSSSEHGTSLQHQTRSSPRRRTRLARGPLTIGEAAPHIDVRLAGTSEPYRPDTIADGGGAFGLTVRAASVRGLFKRYVGGARQDDLCLRLHAPTRTLIVAVADGVSAAARSDLGAALAVRHATAAVSRQLDAGRVDIDWGEVFRQAAWALVEEHRRACGEPSASVEDAAAALATTLIAATVTATDKGSGDATGDSQSDPAGEPREQAGDSQSDPAGEPQSSEGFRIQAAAVGDSPALLLAHRRFEPLVGEARHSDGLLGGGVPALPRHTEPVCASTRLLDPAEVLLVCSDGLALPLGDGEGEVGQLLVRELAKPPDIVDFARLLDFSRSTYDDDRTLVAVWPRSEQ